MTFAPDHSADASAPRILLACGGTGGHVYPAIAVADALRLIDTRAHILFAGTRNRMEWQAVPKAGYEIQPVAAAGFQRGFSLSAIRRNLTLPFILLKGMLDARKLVREFDPHVVVGTGGYASGPVGAAAAARNVPLVLQEQNAYPGATNRMLGRQATKIFIAFEAARSHFPEGKTDLAGNPVREDLTQVDVESARAHFGLASDQQAILVMGGSLGAGPVNSAVRKHLDAILQVPSRVLIWQTGTRYFDDLQAELPFHPRVRLLPYLDRMDFAYAVADVVVCRSGAITCSELTVTGTPSILVPSPNVAEDHQTANARSLADNAAAVLLPESQLEAGLVDALDRLLNSEAERTAMAQAAKALARPEAARVIAQAVLDLAQTGTEP